MHAPASVASVGHLDMLSPNAAWRDNLSPKSNQAVFVVYMLLLSVKINLFAIYTEKYSILYRMDETESLDDV